MPPKERSAVRGAVARAKSTIGRNVRSVSRLHAGSPGRTPSILAQNMIKGAVSPTKVGREGRCWLVGIRQHAGCRRGSIRPGPDPARARAKVRRRRSTRRPTGVGAVRAPFGRRRAGRQGVAQCPDVREAVGGLLGQAAEHDLFEVGGHAGMDLGKGHDRIAGVRHAMKLLGPLPARSPGLPLALALEIERDCSADETLQGRSRSSRLHGCR